MNKKEGSVTKYPESIETRTALLEMSISHINEALIRIDQGIKEFRRDVKSDLRWLVGLVIAFGTGLMGVMAHGFHWF